MVSLDQIKELRDSTGISVMQCKRALEEALGDMNKALLLLKKKSADMAGKYGERELGAGTVAAYIHNTGTTGSLVLLSCQTDFVAKNEEFKALAYDIAMQVTATKPEDGKALLEQPFIKDETLTIKNLIDKFTQKFGERIEIKDFSRSSVSEN